MKAVLNRALGLVRRAVDERRSCIHRLEPSPPAGSSLERTVANLLGDMTTGRVPRFRIFVQGAPLTLNPPIQQQLFLIVHEAATIKRKGSVPNSVYGASQGWGPKCASPFLKLRDALSMAEAPCRGDVVTRVVDTSW